MRSTTIILLLLWVSSLELFGAETNTLLVFHAEKRAGAMIFVDECLARGLTNSMAVAELRAWATNTIQRYQQPSKNRYALVPDSDIPKSVQMLQTRIPSCRFSYADATNVYFTIAPHRDPPKVDFFQGSSREIEAINISWYGYGVIVGPESFKPKWEHEPWYHRKLADGVYLWHGYK
jgi:hypothetical protein